MARAKKKPTGKKSVEALEELAATLLALTGRGKRAKTDESDAIAQRQIKDEQSRQAEEQHYWVRVLRLGPDDNEEQVFVGAAGVPYWIKKGERVPLPISAITALKYTQVNSVVKRDGKLYRVKYDQYPIQNDGPADMAEVRAWKAERDRKLARAYDIVETAADGESIIEEIGRPAVEYGPTVPVLEG